MSKKIDDLNPYLDKKVIEVLKGNGYSEIWDDQWDCIQKCLVKCENVFIGIPTGSGKTFPALLSIINTVLKKKGKAIYIVPLRALARQKYDQFTKILVPLGISVGITTGDYAKFEYTDIGKKDVIIATIEKIDSLIRHNEEWLYDVSLFVIDEIQMVGDATRGLTLEITVSEIIRKFKKAQRIALSAVIGNPNDFKNWMADDLVYNKNRIIPLYGGILTYLGGLSEIKRKFQVNIPIRKNLYKYPAKKTDPGKSLRYSNTIDLVKYFINNEKQCIIFTNARDHAENLAISLADDVNSGGYKINKAVCGEISQLLNDSIEEETKFSKDLVRCTSLGISFHHAGLQLIQRDIIENSFISKKLKVLVATPTLEQGVNLPSNVVIISDAVRWNSRDRVYEDLPVNNVLNMMGRAGRAEYHEFGEAILVEDQLSDNKLYGKYIAKEPEKVLSQLRIAITRQKHLNGLIASNKIVPVDEIYEYFKTTLWYTIYEYEFEEFDLIKEIHEDLSYLEKNGFIRTSGSYYISTQFGRAVSDSCIDCKTALLFLSGSKKIVDNLEAEKDIDNPWPIFQLLLLSHEVNTYRPYDNDFNGLEIASQFKDKGLLLTEMPNEDKEIYSRRSIAASLFCDWIDEKPLTEIINEYPELRDADFYEIGEVLEWLGDALVKIATLTCVPRGITDKILIYCDRAVRGVKEELLEYQRIEGVRRKSARSLFDAGFSYESLKNLNHKTLSVIVGPFVSKKIRDHFEKIRTEGEKPIFNKRQIYDEIDEIITGEKQITDTVEKLGKNDQNINNYLKDERLKQRYEKITQFCQNQLTWMHSDLKFFRFFTNHGIPHSSNILNMIFQLLDDWDLISGDKKLNEYELFLLAVCSWCHDLGMLNQEGENFDDYSVVEKVRKEHAKRIIPYLSKNYLIMGLSNELEKKLVEQICVHHSSKERIDDVNDFQDIILDNKRVRVRTRLISALLRLSDALDIDKNRLPREENRNHELISDATKREYKKHEMVHGVAINSVEESILIQILINEQDPESVEIYNEIKQKLTEEFESVKAILLDYGINIKYIYFFVV